MRVEINHRINPTLKVFRIYHFMTCYEPGIRMGKRFRKARGRARPETIKGVDGSMLAVAHFRIPAQIIRILVPGGVEIENIC